MNKSSQTTLHSLWDTGIISHRIERDFYSNSSIYYEYIYQLMMNQSPTENDNDVQQWIKESLNFVCQQIYFDDNNKLMNASIRFNLSENYYQRSFPVIDQRLAHGGRRLGILLNRLGQTESITSVISVTTKLSLIACILIGILCVAFILGVALVIFFVLRRRTKHP